MTKPSSPPSTRLQPQRRGPDCGGATRRDLPDLRAQLRRRQRRRHGRPRRRALAARLPARPRRRRASGSPLVPVAARRRRLRRRRLPRHRPGVRRRSPRPRRSSPRRSRSASAPSSTSSPTTSPTEHPWFQAALAAGPGSPERERFWFHPGKGQNGDEMPTHWVVELPGRRRGPAPRTPTARPASGTCTCSRPSSPTSTGTTPTSAREHEDILRFWFDRGVAGVRIDSAALLDQGPRRCPRSRRSPARASTRTPTATSCTTSTAAGARSPTPTRAARPGRRGLAAGHRAVRRATCAPTRCTPRSTSTSWRGRGTRTSCASRSTPRSPRTPRSARRRRGCCPTTTSPGRSPGTAARTSSFAFADEALRHPDRPRARHAPGPGGRPAHARRCRARSTSTRATSSACPRSRTCRSSCSQDPMHFRSGRRRPGPRRMPRAAAVVAATAPPFGFSPDAASRSPWLPQPADWAALTVEAQDADPGSTLRLYRAALRLAARAARARRRPAELARRRADGVLAFRRGDDFVVRRRTSATTPSRCPTHDRILAREQRRSTAALLPADSTAGCDVPPPQPPHERRRRRHRHHAHTKGKTMKSPRKAASPVVAAGASLDVLAALRRLRRERQRRAARPSSASPRFPPGADAGRLRRVRRRRRRSSRRRNPNIDVIGVEYEWDGPDLRRPARRRQPARRLHGAVHRRQDAARERPAHGRHRRGRGARLRRQVQPDHPRGRARTTTATSSAFPRQAYAMGLHYNRDAVRGRPGSTPTSPPTTWDEVREARQGDRRRRPARPATRR